MKLTSEQESALLRQYDPLLHSFVHEFHRKGGSRGVDNTEDLVQEARLEFLRHLRRIPDPSQIARCRYHVLGALCTYCRTMAIVQIPKYRFHRTVREVLCVRDGEDTVACQRTNTEDDALLNVELDRFLESLTPEEQTVVQMKLDGYTSREIIPVVKAKGEPQMSHLLSKIRKKARAFFKRE